MAQNRNNSSGFKDIISNSDLVSPGPPAVYQLKLEKQKIGSLTSVTVGEKQESKPNKTILLVGETGTGKSTLVNALFNYAVGVIFEDEIWFQIEDQTTSQTSDVIIYQIFGAEDQTLPFSLTIIDTPGYGNTQDADHNIRINHQLMKLIQSADGIHEVHAVGLVMKDGENPVTDRLKYIYDFIKSQFGKDVEKNIVALMTNSHGKPPENVLQALEDANIKYAKNEENEMTYFQFDNCQDEERTKKSKKYLGKAWRLSEEGMEEFTDFLKESPPLQLNVMMKEHKEQIRLTACIQNLQERIRFTELKIRDLERTQEAHCINKQNMKRDKSFNVLIPETYKDLQSLRDGRCGYETSLYCLVCKENCHYPGCTEALNPQQCEVMRNGKCTSCTNKCPASDHVKQNWQFELKTQMLEKTKKALKQQYKQESREKIKLSERLKKEKTKLKEEKTRLINEAFEYFIKLHQSANNDNSINNSASTFVILDFLIKKMKGKGNGEKLQKLEEIYSQMDPGIKTQLRERITSSLQEALISESTEIHQGPPALYQMIPKKEMIGTLSKVTVGQKDEMKINKTILLVGETGAGKSTLINALFNYAVGVKFDDQVWFQIVEEKSNQTESQTSDVIVYQIFGFEGQTLPFSLTIIDTPGFGSTRGIEEDDSVSQRLFDLFRSQDGVHQINAVGLVVKASDYRLSNRLTYVFDAVMSLFGNDLEKNIVALITHSDGQRPENVLKALEEAKIKCSKGQNDLPVHFLFNNQQKRQKYTTEKDKDGSKYSWDFTNEKMGHLRDFLEKTKPQPLVTTVEVLNERIRLKACIQNLKERIELNEQTENEIRVTKEALKKHEDEMDKDINFTMEVDEVYKEKEPISGGMRLLMFYKGAVTCSVCKENCHYPGCTMAHKPGHCKVMKKGHCTVCTNKCPESVHVKENWSYVTKTRKVQKTLNDVKEKYEKNKAECEKKSTLLENLEKETSKLTTERSELLDQAYGHIIKLKEIALKVGSMSTLAHLDFLIDKMKEKRDQKKVQELEELKKRMVKETEGQTQLQKVGKMFKDL